MDNLDAVRASTGARHYPLRVHLAWVIVGLVMVSGALLGWNGYRQSSSIMLADTRQLAESISQEATAEVGRLYAAPETLAGALSLHRVAGLSAMKERLESLPFLMEILRATPALASVYFGYESGDFLLVRNVKGRAAAARPFSPPEGTAFVVQLVESRPAGPSGRYQYYGDDGRLLEDRAQPDYRFDPRTRPWYKLARGSDEQVRTPLYAFFSTGEVGTTLARAAPGRKAVAAVDITLAELSAMLGHLDVSPSAQRVMFDAQGTVMAYQDAAKVVLKSGEGTVRLAKLEELGSPAVTEFSRDIRKGKFSLSVQGSEWVGYTAALPMRGELETFISVMAPRSELLTEAARIRTESIWLTLLVLLAALPLAWWISHRVASPLATLADAARAVQRFDFSDRTRGTSRIAEVAALDDALASMKSTIRRFLDVSAALSAERDMDRLLARVLKETLGIAGAEAGEIWLLSEDGSEFVLAETALASGAPASWSRDALKVDAPELPGFLRAAMERKQVSEVQGGVDGFAGPVARELGAARVWGVSVPLVDRDGRLVGVVVTYGSGDGATTDVGPERRAFLEALTGTTAVSIETRQLIQAQKELLDAFIKLIAGAIDAKSPYTGGHCQRVPALTAMLARAAEGEQAGPFADFRLTPEQWEELHIASWLHDCGKVTTPEYVVDKATKLETQYDRIHEVRMRFEACKRDVVADYWQARALGDPQGRDEAALAAARDAELAALDADFAFVAECNLGGEFMAPDKVERLKAIGARTWTRTLDDRLGVSHEEARRMAKEPAPALPVQEPLLADKGWHIVPRAAADRMPEDNPWGFRLQVPEHKFNRGELYNLAIARGTLTNEERYAINDHIVQTITMLSELPFPRHLRRVPEIAGGHHEKMDGTGYPKRLSREEMSMPARMMAIADIFEALTAADRPYKSGKKLSEAIKIMSFMKKDQHIDPDLFELFLRTGVYKEYAAKFLAPGQIDEVDVSVYLKAA